MNAVSIDLIASRIEPFKALSDKILDLKRNLEVGVYRNDTLPK